MSGGAPAADPVEAAVSARLEAADAFFDQQAPALARCCRAMADRFSGGGRLIAIGPDPAARADALCAPIRWQSGEGLDGPSVPALAITAEGGPAAVQLQSVAEAADVVIAFGLDAGGLAAAEAAAAMAFAADAGCLTITFASGGPAGERFWEFDPPSSDPDIRQELAERAHHMLFRGVRACAGSGLWQIGDPGPGAGVRPPAAEIAADTVVTEIESLIRAEAAEAATLCARTLRGSASELTTAAVATRESLDHGGRVLTIGAGPAATRAIDAAADLRLPPVAEWAPRRALQLTAGVAGAGLGTGEPDPDDFRNQLIAHGRPGDVLLAFWAGGAPEAVLRALEEAGRRRIATIAVAGGEGGQTGAAERADSSAEIDSRDPLRVQEAQTAVAHVLRDLIELAPSAAKAAGGEDGSQ